MTASKLNYTNVVLEAATLDDVVTLTSLFKATGCVMSNVEGKRLKGAVASSRLEDLRLLIIATNEWAGFPAVRMI